MNLEQVAEEYLTDPRVVDDTSKRAEQLARELVDSKPFEWPVSRYHVECAVTDRIKNLRYERGIRMPSPYTGRRISEA